ncbi:hypothetical protein ACHAXS_010048, partial [Conticribra weissflogii]
LLLTKQDDIAFQNFYHRRRSPDWLLLWLLKTSCFRNSDFFASVIFVLFDRA